jgi:ubiquinone/menaquinone biosynthesis C-methylase UbiE
VFQDVAFARRYANKHRALGERLGREYAGRLAARGFAGGRILDAGCGAGATLLILARSFPEAELVGVDLSDPLLTLARDSVGGTALEGQVRFQKVDVQDLPYPDASFDVVLSAFMAHLVQDPVGMLDELERVLAPLGVLFMVDLRRSCLGWIEREIRSAFSLGEARALLSRSRVREGDLAGRLLTWSFESRPVRLPSVPA